MSAAVAAAAAPIATTTTTAGYCTPMVDQAFTLVFKR